MDFRDRQCRPRAYNDPGHAHELTFSCFRRIKMLSKERTCQWMAESIAVACRELNYQLWAYVFMPEHVHLVVCAREREYDTSQLLGRIKEPVSRAAVQFLKRESPEWLTRIRVGHGERPKYHFWQPGRGHDRNVIKGKTLLHMIDYTHQNPVRRRLVEQARDWKWSSAGWYEEKPLNELRPDPIPWDWLEETN